VWLRGRAAAGPGELELAADPRHALALERRLLGRQVAGGLVDDGVEEAPLFRVHARRWQSGQRAEARARPGQDVVGRRGLVDGLPALLVVEAGEQAKAEIFLAAEDPGVAQKFTIDARRVGAEEEGRRHQPHAVDQGDVDRHVVPLEAPAPAFAERRLAEDRQVIGLGIADERAAAAAQHLLQRHDGARLEQALPAERGGEKAVGQVALRRAKIGEGDALSRLGHVVPSLALVGGKGQVGAPALLRRQGREEPAGGLGHVGRQRDLAGDAGRLFPYRRRGHRHRAQRPEEPEPETSAQHVRASLAGILVAGARAVQSIVRRSDDRNSRWTVAVRAGPAPAVSFLPRRHGDAR
jgi:hypothetical protein